MKCFLYAPGAKKIYVYNKILGGAELKMVTVEELQEDALFGDERRDIEQRLVVRVKPYRRRCFELEIVISASSTCADLLDGIVECTSELGWCDGNSKWILLEQWMGIGIAFGHEYL